MYIQLIHVYSGNSSALKIEPSLTYAGEVWGLDDDEQIEKNTYVCNQMISECSATLLKLNDIW